MRVPRVLFAQYWTSPDKNPDFLTPKKNVSGSFDEGTGLYSSDQPVGNCNEGVAGVIEHLDIFQCF